MEHGRALPLTPAPLPLSLQLHEMAWSQCPLPQGTQCPKELHLLTRYLVDVGHQSQGRWASMCGKRWSLWWARVCEEGQSLGTAVSRKKVVVRAWVK